MEPLDGLFGLAFLLFGFLLQNILIIKNGKSKFSRTEKVAYAVNVAGAGLLSFYAFRIDNIYFAILETVWLVSTFIVLATRVRSWIAKESSLEENSVSL